MHILLNKIRWFFREYGIARGSLRIATEILYAITVPLYERYIMHHCSVKKDLILFVSKPSFSDNSKALYEYMLKSGHFKNNKFVWLVDWDFEIVQNYDRTTFIKTTSLYHTGFTFQAIKYISQSAQLFYTHTSPLKSSRKKDGQLVVNLWHGSGYKKNSSSESAFDAALVSGPIYVKEFSKAWHCNEEKIYPIGYPRYDWFCTTSKDACIYTEQIKRDATKLVMWMPTFRNTGKGIYAEEKLESSLELPLVAQISDIRKLDNFCRQHHIMLCIKRHASQVIYLVEKEKFTNLVFISNVDFLVNRVNLYAFLSKTDALISDYSSAAVDYMLLNRPIAFVLDDYDEYARTRGFKFEHPLEYMPGHHLYQIADLYNFLDDVRNNVDRFGDARKNLMPSMHNECKCYCERIINELHLHCK